MKDNVRALCLEVLDEVFEKNVFCNTALHRAIELNKNLDERDRRFLTALTEGTVERCIEIDYLINQYSVKKVDKLKPYIRNILRMSVYQIKYMEQVPDSAAVNEAVVLVVKKGYKGLRGFVNGVLRNMVRTLQDVKYPDAAKEPVKYLSIMYSMPEWLVEHYLNELQFEDVENCFRYFLKPADITIRCTGKGYSKEELVNEYECCDILSDKKTIFDYSIRLKRHGKINNLLGFNEGSFVVQDESSMIPAHIAMEYVKQDEDMNVSESLSILDMCAAPGGKALHIAGGLAGKATVHARDISEYKTGKILENAGRLGINNIDVSVSDAMEHDMECVNAYDIVIADLPCSGLGVLAKKSDIKYNASKEGLAELADMQASMLDNAADYVKTCGIIVFSTCTINMNENELNVEHFLRRHPEYSLINAKDYIPVTLHGALTEEGYVKVIPGKYDSDGFFVAVFRRNS